MTLIPAKTCVHCKQEKPLAEFFKFAGGADGYQHRCKLCEMARRKAQGQKYSRGRPRKDYLETLKKPRKADYERIASACVAAIIAGHGELFMVFPYIFTYPKTFPKGIVVSRAGRNCTRKVQADKMLSWLHERGYTAVTPERLKAQMSIASRAIDNLLKGLE